MTIWKVYTNDPLNGVGFISSENDMKDIVNKFGTKYSFTEISDSELDGLKQVWYYTLD